MPLLLEVGARLLLEDGGALLLESDPAILNPPPTPPAPPETRFSVDLCGAGWQRIAMAETFTFQAKENANAPGEWELETTPAGVTGWSPTGDLLDGIPLLYGPTDVACIRLVRGDDIELAGLVAKVSEGNGGFEEINEGNGRITWRWSGPDLWGILADAVAYPSPAIEPPWPDAYDVRTGLASNVLAEYLAANIGAAALPDRIYTGLEVDDQSVGPSGTYSARLQTLAELAGRIATDGQFRCRLSLEWDGQVNVILEPTVDLSPSIIFSDQSDLANVQIRRVPRSADTVIAGGTGEGATRLFAEASVAPPAGQARRTVFSDQSSLTTTHELQLSAESTLRSAEASWSINADVTDAIASTSWRYGSDFRIGDLVAIEVDGVRYPVPVTSASFDISAGRSSIRPQLGTAAPDDLHGLIKDVADLSSRFGRDVK